MPDDLEREETILRRRLLFRLLRRQGPDARPRHSELISDPVPRGLIRPEFQGFTDWWNRPGSPRTPRGS